MNIKKTKQETTIYVSIYIFCLLPFLSVAGLVQLGDTIYTLWKLLGMFGFVSMLFLFFYNKGVRFNKFIACLIIYEFLDLSVGIVYHGIRYGRIAASLTVIAITFLIQYDAKRIIKAFLCAGIAIILINSIYMLFVPIAEETTYFIGGKNSLSIFIMPVLIMLLLNNQVKGGKIGMFHLLFVGVAMANIALAKSGTGVITVGIAALLFISSPLIKRKSVLLIAYLSVLFLLVWSTSLLSENKYWLRLLGALGKDATLTGRMAIWENILKKLEGHQAFGIGAGTIIVRQENKIISESHNILLEILLCTGFIGLAVYALYFYFAIRDLNLKDKKQKTIFIGILVLLINGLTESINNTMFFTIMLAISYYYSTEEKVSVAHNKKYE